MTDNPLHLHIIAFDIPWPADYGGVIHIFHKVRLLAAAGVHIHLHCFRYGDRQPADELLRYCDEVRYYERRTGLPSFLSFTPYIIRSRKNRLLEQVLLRDRYPILCEGIHTCAILINKKLQRRRILFRPSNIEHEYYRALAAREKNLFKKFFFLTEAFKLKRWERHLEKASVILPVSDNDLAWFEKRFPAVPSRLIYSFTPYDEVEVLTGRGEYALFHGKLSVQDNAAVAAFLADEVAPHTSLSLVVAGMDPPAWLRKKIGAAKGITLVENPDDGEMGRLIREAQVQLMLTFQASGIKLKLLLSLFRGRYIVVNTPMLTSAGLEGCVEQADEGPAIAAVLERVKGRAWTDKEVEERKKCIPAAYYNREKTKSMVEEIEKLISR